MHFCNLIKVKIENFLNARRTRAPTATLDRIEEFEITKEVPPTVSHYSFGSLCVNPTIHGGGPKVLVSGAFQSNLRDPKFWHNSYMILRIGFLKKNFKIFSIFFLIFFQFFPVFWTSVTNKKIFLHF